MEMEEFFPINPNKHEIDEMEPQKNTRKDTK